MDNLAAIAGTFATTKAGLTAGTTTTYSTTATVQFCIRGKSYSKTAVANGATPTTVVKNKKALSEAGLKRQKAEFEQLYKGPRNSHKTS